MKKVLLATEKPFADPAVAGIRNVFSDAGYELSVLEKYTGQEPLIQAIKEAHAVIIRSDVIDRNVIEHAPDLKIVVRAGAGYDNIDLKACTEKGIVAMNTPGQNSNAVAELLFGMMLYTVRKQFNGDSGTELREKSIGIHGFGWVGRYVAAIARGFGMKIHAFDPFVDAAVFEKEGVTAHKDLQSLYENCQFITLHIPLTDTTKESVNYSLLSKMPKGATLINTARKELTSESSLLQMFQARKDFTYLADVQPDCAQKIAILYPGRYLFTPKKMGAQTEEANNNAGIAAANQIVNFFEKGDVSCKVN